jgi:hypothetical protein
MGGYLISKMDLREIGCEDGRWIEQAQDHVQWRDLVLAVLNLRVLLPESQDLVRTVQFGCDTV